MRGGKNAASLRLLIVSKEEEQKEFRGLLAYDYLIVPTRKDTGRRLLAYDYLIDLLGGILITKWRERRGQKAGSLRLFNRFIIRWDTDTRILVLIGQQSTSKYGCPQKYCGAQSRPAPHLAGEDNESRQPRRTLEFAS
jgi:hypothetical protein